MLEAVVPECQPEQVFFAHILQQLLADGAFQDAVQVGAVVKQKRQVEQLQGRGDLGQFGKAGSRELDGIAHQQRHDILVVEQ